MHYTIVNEYGNFLYKYLNYRNTPLNLPGATISSPPGPAGHRTPYGLLRVAHENLNLEGVYGKKVMAY